MYKSYYNLQSECLIEGEQKITAPFLNSYFIHNIIVSVNGVRYQEGHGNDFHKMNHEIQWTGSFDLSNTDVIIIEIDYFYIQVNNISILDFIIDSDMNYIDKPRTKKIVSKHYSEAQFSLDTGLYKNAVLNFGTVLEGLLNKNLSHTKLNDLITNYTGSADKTKMNQIRIYRNLVHPNRIFQDNDITRHDALTARNNLEAIIGKLNSGGFNNGG